MNQSSLPVGSPAAFRRTRRSERGEATQEWEKLMNCEERRLELELHHQYLEMFTLASTGKFSSL